MFLNGLEVIIRSLHHWSTYLWIIKAGDPGGWNTVRITHCTQSPRLIRPGLCHPCVGHNERECHQESCQIQVAVITTLLVSPFLLGHSSCRTNQINSKASFHVRVFPRCGWMRRFMVVWDFLDLEEPSVAMSEPGPSFVIVLDGTLSLVFSCFLFLSMLVIKDICSSLPHPVQKQLLALKYGIELVLSCCVKFFNGK